MGSRSQVLGFSLVELIAVLALTGIVAALGAQMMARPLGGYADTAHAARSAYGLDLIVGRIARDVRAAKTDSLDVLGDRVLLLQRAADSRNASHRNNETGHAVRYIAYICEPQKRRLRRFESYEAAPAHSITREGGQLLGTQMSGCRFVLDRDMSGAGEVLTMAFSMNSTHAGAGNFNLVAQARPPAAW